MRRSLITTVYQACILSVLAISIVSVGGAQVRTSTSYQLQSDSINIGGGLSSSTSYVQENTVGEIATGQSGSASYQVRAGYQQMQEVYLSMTTPSDVTMSPSLPGLTGGTSNGSTAVVVTTDSPAGYQLTIESSNTPAMQNESESIADYMQGADPDFLFTIGAASAQFGFSPSSVDIPQSFKDNGTTCAVGTLDTALACWAGLSTSPTLIAKGTGANHPSGATTTINFRVGIGSNAGVIAGLYTATTTLTALPL
jgi:hypothetical protein